MSVTVLIPTPLRPYVDGKDEVVFSQSEVSVAAILTSLVDTHIGLKKHLYDDAGNLRRFINIYLNDEDVRYQNGVDTLVKAADVISIVPSIAGGI